MNTYLVYGTDYELIKREVDELIKDFDDVARYDLSEQKIDYLLDDASCMSLFGNNKVLIGENALFLTTNKCDVNHNIDYLTSYLNDNNHDNTLIFTVLSDSLDGKKKIVKLLKEKAKVIYKEKIDDKNLSSFVTNELKNHGYKIGFKEAKYFIDVVGKNVDIILSEIKKLIAYKDLDKVITIEDINNISSVALKDNIFDLTDAIMKKNYKTIMSCYNDLLKCNEEPVKIISMLGSQFTLIYQCKLLANKGKGQSVISDILEIHPYRVKLALESDYLEYEVINIIKKLHDLDYKIKSGATDKYDGLEMFLLTL